MIGYDWMVWIYLYAVYVCMYQTTIGRLEVRIFFYLTFIGTVKTLIGSSVYEHIHKKFEICFKCFKMKKIIFFCLFIYFWIFIIIINQICDHSCGNGWKKNTVQNINFLGSNGMSQKNVYGRIHRTDEG